MDPAKLLKTLVKGQGSILIPHLDRYLEKRNFPPSWNIEIPNFKGDDGFYHPSSHTFSEPRYLFFDRLGARTGEQYIESEKISANLQRTFANGHMWHGYLGAVFMDMGLVDSKNVEIHFKKEITTEWGSVMGSGTIDLLDVEIPGHGDWLVDMKTVNSREFGEGVREFTMKKWEAQVNCYGDWAGREKMMILAIEKDTPHRLMEFQIARNEKLLEEIYERWIYTEYHIGKGDPPQCDHEYGVGCALKDLCSYRANSVD